MLILAYKRVDHVFNGSISMWAEKGEVPPAELDAFEGFSFARMMARFSKQAMRYPDVPLHMKRLERAELEPVLLDDATTHLLRTDPAKAIEAMSPNLNQASGRTAQKLKTAIKSAHDSLSESFGDSVYCKMRFKGDGIFEVECPFTGKWVGLGMKDEQFLAKTGRQNAHVDWIPIDLQPQSRTENPRWAVVKTEVLLERKKDRYFLPRKWNPKPPWISHEDLQVMYDQYRKERDDVQSTAGGDDPQGPAQR
jgi:hypothetical protein